MLKSVAFDPVTFPLHAMLREIEDSRRACNINRGSAQGIVDVGVMPEEMGTWPKFNIRMSKTAEKSLFLSR